MLSMDLQSDAFAGEISSRLARMRNETYRGETWPEGCYGSAAAWVVFVGPSPGGGSKSSPDRGRVASGGTPLWDSDFLGPIERWSNGFRASMKPLVETIVGLPFEKGSAKVYAFVNFHWQQNPDASLVPMQGMTSGAHDAIAVLSAIQPRLIVPMEKRSDRLLRESLLGVGYSTEGPRQCTAHVDINGRGRAHRQMAGYVVSGGGLLANCIVVRSPQHPARIFDSKYAFRCGRAIRSFASQLASGHTCVTIDERA